MGQDLLSRTHTHTHTCRQTHIHAHTHTSTQPMLYKHEGQYTYVTCTHYMDRHRRDDEQRCSTEYSEKCFWRKRTEQTRRTQTYTYKQQVPALQTNLGKMTHHTNTAQRTCPGHTDMGTHMAKSEHWLVSFIKAIDLHLSIVTTQK